MRSLFNVWPLQIRSGARAGFTSTLALLENALESRPFFVGSSFTIADLALFAKYVESLGSALWVAALLTRSRLCRLLDVFGLLYTYEERLSLFPSLAAWFTSVYSHPAVTAALVELRLAMGGVVSHPALQLCHAGRWFAAAISVRLGVTVTLHLRVGLSRDWCLRDSCHGVRCRGSVLCLHVVLRP